ncbi:MAM1 (YER106W) [Zygosaccharomyces parabailii]|uniref:ZYBA0S08-02696g1_1 n=1 Tax=Zygosaccharomyces bailii (strain CLIB 213 / ATCC 58445 / CBS 680 / BCRC 21525 / NBRC 1098 / NCYC 1416 / NRRL Y-2227) TaxID=1333698 RepID=A0A8J2T873_ZYGB2|nr:MAM1 (YER106W) [Zygosaccharomyces parabailii]CDF90774.1 ZYBA0S08-02696g1_1 [Zygosaccharomyces bailii CLIB 213]
MGTQPLGTKSPNIVSPPVNQRASKLKRKWSSQNPQNLQISNEDECSRDNLRLHGVSTAESPPESDLSKKFEHYAANMPINEGIFGHKQYQTNMLPLTECNLNLLQNKMVELENKLFRCNLPLLHSDNKCYLNSIRLWLLFEMEMLCDNSRNLRDACYRENVYEAVCPQWKIKSCLVQELPHGFEPFPLEQLSIPDIQVVCNHQNVEGTLVEEKDLVEQHKKIPPTLLSCRKKKIFDERPINTDTVVITKSEIPNRNTFANSSIEDENDQGATLRKKKHKKEPQICTLERKLALLNGSSEYI